MTWKNSRLNSRLRFHLLDVEMVGCGGGGGVGVDKFGPFGLLALVHRLACLASNVCVIFSASFVPWAISFIIDNWQLHHYKPTLRSLSLNNNTFNGHVAIIDPSRREQKMRTSKERIQNLKNDTSAKIS